MCFQCGKGIFDRKRLGSENNNGGTDKKEIKNHSFARCVIMDNLKMYINILTTACVDFNPLSPLCKKNFMKKPFVMKLFFL